jgi:hypothetical protein
MSGIIVGGTVLNAKILEAKVTKAFETWARFDVNDYFRDQFLEDKWDYDGETQRKSGEFVGPEPRNIFDLGDLYRSGRDSFKIEQGGVDITASWDWDAKNSSGRGYAWYVHEGLSTNIEPRQWTDIFQQRDLFSQSGVSKELRSRIRTALNK